MNSWAEKQGICVIIPERSYGFLELYAKAWRHVGPALVLVGSVLAGHTGGATGFFLGLAALTAFYVAGLAATLDDNFGKRGANEGRRADKQEGSYP